MRLIISRFPNLRVLCCKLTEYIDNLHIFWKCYYRKKFSVLVIFYIFSSVSPCLLYITNCTYIFNVSGESVEPVTRKTTCDDMCSTCYYSRLIVFFMILHKILFLTQCMKQYDLEITIKKKKMLFNLLDLTKTAYPVLLNLNSKTKASSPIRERLMLKHILCFCRN